MKKINNLEVILKTAERCNLNCSYCYFFQGEDKSYQKHPSIIKRDTIKRLTLFLINGVSSLGIKNLQIYPL